MSRGVVVFYRYLSPMANLLWEGGKAICLWRVGNKGLVRGWGKGLASGRVCRVAGHELQIRASAGTARLRS